MTMTPMYDGTPVVGGGLFPGAVVKVELQAAAGLVVGRPAGGAGKPLNKSGAGPPGRVFSVHQLSLHQLTWVDGVAAAVVRSPSANAPRDGNAKTMTAPLALEPV